MRRFLNKKIILWLAVAGLLIFLHLIRALTPLESGAVRLTSPFLASSYSWAANISSFYRQIKDSRQLAAKNKELTEKISQMAVDKARLEKLSAENERLRAYLNFARAKKVNYLMANIIRRQNNLLTIDQGQSKGLKAGLVAVNKDGVVIGKIIKTKPNLAQIALVTDRHCQLAASVINEQKTSGLAIGELGLTIAMGYIPQTEEIKENDLVITSGLEPYIPRGLPIGQVVKIEKNSNELWQKAVLEPIADLDHLTIVMVILP